MVGFLYPYHQHCSYCSGLPGSFPGFWWPHSENYTLGIVSEACFRVNDILGNGETVSEPLWGRILVVSWQFCLWYNSDDILAFPVAGVCFTFLGSDKLVIIYLCIFSFQKCIISLSQLWDGDHRPVFSRYHHSLVLCSIP